MSARWKLTVEGLGRIGRAEVEVHPLLLLVGENNTGKSYLASLLWGLFTMQANLVSRSGAALDACDRWIEQAMPPGNREGSVVLTPDDIVLFDKLFDAAVEENRSRLVQRVFNNETTRASSIKLKNLSRDRRTQLRWSASDEKGNYVIAIKQGADAETETIFTPPAQLKISDMIQNPLHRIIRHLASALLSRELAFGTMTRQSGFFDEFSDIDPVYLPASRTGFMQLYKAAARRSFKEAFKTTPDGGGEQKWLNLTAPAFHFIDMLAFGLQKGGAGLYAEEAALLEQALHGQIELATERGVNDYRYRPRGASAPLPMGLSSSLVTELAPIVLVLRHLSDFPVLILEEPEAHLHPALQRRLAQVVVRLVRKGLHVWITTHSENFCQQINNFLKIGASADREALQAEFGYGPQDYLVPDDVAGYQFQLEGEQSVVTALEQSEEGLTMPTFNRELIALSKETLLLQRRAKGAS